MNNEKLTMNNNRRPRLAWHPILAAVFAFLLLCACSHEEPAAPEAQSNRKERQYIAKGNDLFAHGDFSAAAEAYAKAREANPSSPEATFNQAVATMTLAEAKLAKMPQGQQPDSATLQLEDAATQLYMAAAQMRQRTSPPVAAYACYNLANHYFLRDKLDEAEDMYQEALRLVPAFDDARRNLRITQLKKQQQDQNKDKNKDQNKDQQQNQDQQDKQDQDKQQQQQNQDQQQQQQPQMNSQGILNANNAKEQATRARIDRQRQNRSQSAPHGKNW